MRRACLLIPLMMFMTYRLLLCYCRRDARIQTSFNGLLHHRTLAFAWLFTASRPKQLDRRAMLNCPSLLRLQKPTLASSTAIDSLFWSEFTRWSVQQRGFNNDIESLKGFLISWWRASASSECKEAKAWTEIKMHSRQVCTNVYVWNCRYILLKM